MPWGNGGFHSVPVQPRWPGPAFPFSRCLTPGPPSSPRASLASLSQQGGGGVQVLRPLGLRHDLWERVHC